MVNTIERFVSETSGQTFSTRAGAELAESRDRLFQMIAAHDGFAVVGHATKRSVAHWLEHTSEAVLPLLQTIVGARHVKRNREATLELGRQIWAEKYGTDGAPGEEFDTPEEAERAEAATRLSRALYEIGMGRESASVAHQFLMAHAASLWPILRQAAEAQHILDAEDPIERAARRVVAEMVRRAPVDTGAVKKAWAVGVDGGSRSETIAVSDGAEVEVAQSGTTHEFEAGLDHDGLGYWTSKISVTATAEAHGGEASIDDVETELARGAAAALNHLRDIADSIDVDKTE